MEQNINFSEILENIVQQKDLDFNAAEAVMDEIMSGELTDAQIGSFLTAMRVKGETPTEIAAFASVMRENAIEITPSVPVSEENLIIDTCGTGGDRKHTFNISTAVAFVAAGAGLRVAKHGNRSVSSKCGSADVLAELGVNIEIGAEEVAKCIDEVGIGFLFAPTLHKAMKYAIGPRREMGIRTVFNVLGPLTNPAKANCCILGVFDSALVRLLAEVLAELGIHHALVVHGDDGMDEITTTTTTSACEVTKKKSVENGGFSYTIDEYTISPKALGIPIASEEDLKGGDLSLNANIMRDILGGKKGPKRDIVLLNSAAAIMVADKAESIEEGLKVAADSIDSGKAKEKLEMLIELSQKLGTQ